MKKVFIVHGWGGRADEPWMKWLKGELEARDVLVVAKQMPEAATPHIVAWVSVLADIVGIPDEQTYFVGHSIGCQTILRYIETLSAETKIGGAVFVAPWLTQLTGIEAEDDEVHEIAKEWLETPIDLVKVRERLPVSVAIFSDNDYYVPLAEEKTFRDKLGAKIIIEHGLGHMSSEDGVEQVPSILSSVLSLMG